MSVKVRGEIREGAQNEANCVPLIMLLLVALTPATKATAQSMEAVAGSDTISYATVGRGATTLLLVHGWSNNRTFWEPHLSTLSQSHHLVTVDLASFGESTSHRSNWTIESFADDLEAVCWRTSTRMRFGVLQDVDE